MSNRSEIRNPLTDVVIPRAVRLAQTPGIGSHVSGANMNGGGVHGSPQGYGGIGQSVSGAATSSGSGSNTDTPTQPAGDGSAGNPIRTVNAFMLGVDALNGTAYLVVQGIDRGLTF